MQHDDLVLRELCITCSFLFSIFIKFGISAHDLMINLIKYSILAIVMEI